MKIENIKEYLVRKSIHPEKTSGVELIYNCFLCGNTKHLYVNSQTSQYHCKKCNANGNIFTLMNHFGDKREYKILTPEEIKKNKEREEILQKVESYHSQLPDNVKDYLISKRKFTEESIKKFKIGFCKNSNVFFENRITFPNIINGREVHLTGRAFLENQESKWKHIPGPINYLYNEDALRNEMVVLCEGIPDTITACQWGYNAVGIYGSNETKDEWFYKFDSCKIIYLIPHIKEGKKQGFENTAKKLMKRGKIVKFVTLPEIENVKDLNDLLISGFTKEDFENLIKEAKDYFTLKLNFIPQNTDKIDLPKILEPILKEVAEIYNEVEIETFLTHILKLHFELKTEETKAYRKLIKGYKREFENQEIDKKLLEENKPEIIEITDEEKEEAMEFLKSPDLMERIIDDITTIGYVGENANKFIQYLCATSRKLLNPLHTIIKSPSAWGKSELVKKIMELMPEEDVKYFSRLSKQSLGYMEKDAVRNKWLIIAEAAGSEEADYQIRTLQSEKVIITGVVVKNPVTGKFTTVEKELEGPVTTTVTTTKSIINYENETRVLDLYIDGSEEQTKKVQRELANRKKIEYLEKEKESERIKKKHKTAQRLLRTLKVVTPFVDSITFPSDDPRTRRDFGKFLSLIDAVAFLRQYQKEIKELNDGSEYIEVDIRDYEIVYEFAGDIFSQSLEELPKHSQKLLDKIIEMVNSDTDLEKFTRKDIVNFTGSNYNYVVDWTKPLEKFEYLEIVEGGTQGKKNIYKLSDWVLNDGAKPKPKARGLTTPEELKEKINKTL